MQTVVKSALDREDIDAIWSAAAAALGWRVVRTEAAYASSDGTGNLFIGAREILDADDALAQLVFHELCHALIEGPSRQRLPDWGLANADDRDVAREHACLRMQAHLADPHRLRAEMAPTTEYRAYHDALTARPLEPASDPAAVLARAALVRSDAAVAIAVMAKALAATRAVLDGGDAAALAGGQTAASARASHVTGFPLAAHGETCGGCAWRYRGGRGPAVDRCRQSAGPDGEGKRIAADLPACERWEPPPDCRTCGACCREAYHSVTVAVRDPVVWKQPSLIVRNGHRFEIRRAGDRCAALDDRRAAEPSSLPLFSCTIYGDRPRACRDFEAGGRHCLVARRRVGLSV